MVDEPRVIQKMFDLALWAVPAIGKFPRTHRFVLGERMENLLYDVLDGLIEARYDRGKRAELLKWANIRLEQFRFQMRLAKDLRVLGLKQYEHCSKLVDDVGRQIGGWAKASGAATE